MKGIVASCGMLWYVTFVCMYRFGFDPGIPFLSSIRLKPVYRALND